MSVATAHKVFKASAAIEAAQAAELAARYATAPYQPGDILEYVGYAWQVVRISHYGSGDLLYILERTDLPGSRLDVSIAVVR